MKTGTDKDVEKVIVEPEPTTVQALTIIPAPVNPNIRKNSRYSPTELKTFEVTGLLTVIRHELDEDYHLVIRDRRGRTMIVEAPDPSCAEGSRFIEQIQAVRQAIEERFGVITGTRKPRIMVTVTGIGFFDKLHRQQGVAPNGIELHPLVEIIFR